MEIEGSPNAMMSFAYVEGAEVLNENELVQNWIMSSYKVNSLLSVGGATKKKK